MTAMKKAKYELTLTEAMEVLQIINVHKKIEIGKPANKQDAEEIQLLDELISLILSGDIDGEKFTYEASNKMAFGVWVAVDNFKKYLTEMQATAELYQVNVLLDKLSCKA